TVGQDRRLRRDTQIGMGAGYGRMRQRQDVSWCATDRHDRYVQREASDQASLGINEELSDLSRRVGRPANGRAAQGNFAVPAVFDHCTWTLCVPERSTASTGTLSRGETVSTLPGRSGFGTVTRTSSTYSTDATRCRRA